jgi:translation initiation factor 1
MVEVCPKCGLSKDLCVCEVIEKEAQKIRVYTEKRKFGKITTIIEGITENAKEIVSQLRQKLACGGTIKNNRIELQGDHRTRIKDVLVKLGYSEEQIELS